MQQGVEIMDIPHNTPLLIHNNRIRNTSNQTWFDQHHIENEEFPANHALLKNSKDIVENVQKWYNHEVEATPRQ